MIKSSVFKSIGGCDDNVFVRFTNESCWVSLKNKGNKKFKIDRVKN